MTPDLQSLRRMSETLPGFAIKLDERPEPVRMSADDRDHQRQSERAGASERVGSATDTKPDRQWILDRPWVDALAGERWAMFSRPGDVLVVADLEQQVELLGEQLVVVLEAVSEQRERVDEGAAADHHLRAALRQQVERGEVLKDPHRIRRAEDGYRAGETNATRPRRGGGENHGRGGVEEVLAMMLPNAEHIQPDLVRVLDLLHEVAQALRGTQRSAGLVVCRGETVDSQLH